MSENDPASQEPTEEVLDEQTQQDHAAAQEGEAEQPSEPETRDEEMERLRGEALIAEKKVLQAQAEAENFRKRMRRDLEDQLRFAALPLVEDILSVRDNLLRGLEAAETSADSAGLKEGVAMVAKQLDDALAKHSVEQISTEDATFDPNLHEAISQMPSEEHPSGSIMHVAQTGFKMHDRVIRPTQVVVSSGSSNGQ
ncbi:MAG: nucleotide exchange factor GrpE [Rubripirellula sp.]|nr:nucleotide exchange factor GrpE [Rubripirellula sp.]